MSQPAYRRRRHPFKVPLSRSPSITNLVCLLRHATHPFNCRLPSTRTSHWSTRPIRTRLRYLPQLGMVHPQSTGEHDQPTSISCPRRLGGLSRRRARTTLHLRGRQIGGKKTFPCIMGECYAGTIAKKGITSAVVIFLNRYRYGIVMVARRSNTIRCYD